MTSSTSAERSETFTWTDQAMALQQLPLLTGMDYFSDLRDGSLVPSSPVSARSAAATTVLFIGCRSLGLPGVPPEVAHA
ncbi:hypothetical protein [Arthrobacter sp. NtRootA1]|uniref:hypothetical protein n=1 Tax=Arthrobacter sp. NtRootA1 TaxID=2830983 RepID=UPI001CC64564|nr:hypothetical protein [Arthrobacter sp. NtRootA1]